MGLERVWGLVPGILLCKNGPCFGYCCALLSGTKPCLHDTTGCQTGCQTALTTGLTTVLNEEHCSINRLSNGLYNRLDNRLYTRYSRFVKPVVRPV